MQGVAVTLLTEDRERLPVLQHRLEGTGMGRNVFSHVGFPASPTDPVLRQMQDVRTEVVVVDIDARNPQPAIAAIELIQANTSEIAIFAVGEMNNPPTIVAAMRAGAREFLERNATSEALIEALTRFAASRGKGRTSSGRARIFTVMNSKGGAGGTTVAVNTAIAMQESQGGVLLVDFAPLGHCALHLNVRPTFGVVDALQNLHRLDASLLEGLMTQCKGGLQLLAGPQQPQGLAPTAQAGSTRLPVCSATIRMRSCWSLRQTWFRCGAPVAYARIWKKAPLGTESASFSIATKRFPASPTRT